MEWLHQGINPWVKPEALGSNHFPKAQPWHQGFSIQESWWGRHFTLRS